MKPNTFIFKVQFLVIVCALTCAFSALARPVHHVTVGIAWVPNTKAYDREVRSIEVAGATAVILPQLRASALDYDSDGQLAAEATDEHGVLRQDLADWVKTNTYAGSQASEALRGVDAVVFLGGGDISPTLFAQPQLWHGIEEDNNCNAERDVSEYLTMAYCLDHDIPVLGLCRGMQMLAVVSGAKFIQDIPIYYSEHGKTYNYVHRSLRDEQGKRHYVPHDVTVVDKASILYRIAGTDTLRNVPSWHHQACGDVAGTPLKVTGITSHNGVDIIEAIERTDVSFALGVQFHPEEAVRMNLDGGDGKDDFMSLEEGLSYFRTLIDTAREIASFRSKF